MDALLANPDAPLPADVAALQELVRQLLAEVRRLREGDAQLRQDNEQLRHGLDLALRLHFGQCSERSSPRRERVPRDQAERDEAAPRPGHGRQALPEHLPRERVVYDLAEADKPCPCCAGPRVAAMYAARNEYVIQRPPNRRTTGSVAGGRSDCQPGSDSRGPRSTAAPSSAVAP